MTKSISPIRCQRYVYCNYSVRCPFGKGDARVANRAPSWFARSPTGFNPSSTHAKHHGGLAPRDSTGNPLDDLMTADSPGSLQSLPPSCRAERHFPASGFPDMPPNRIHAGRILLGRARPSGTGSPPRKAATSPCACRSRQVGRPCRAGSRRRRPAGHARIRIVAPAWASTPGSGRLMTSVTETR